MKDNELIKKILKASNIISKKSRNTGSYIVTSKEIHDIIFGVKYTENRIRKLKKIYSF